MLLPLPTRDPLTGHELVVTRLESPASGVVIEGRFSLGWLSRLSPEQVDFVGTLLRSRNNLQKVAADLGVAYNTARNRFDEIVAAVGGPGGPETRPAVSRDERRRALERLAAGEIAVDDAARLLRGDRGDAGAGDVGDAAIAAAGPGDHVGEGE